VGADDVEVLVASGVAGCPDGGVQVVDVGEVGSVGSSVMWWVRTTLTSGPAAAEGLPFIVGAAVWAVSAEGVVSDQQRADPRHECFDERVGATLDPRSAPCRRDGTAVEVALDDDNGVIDGGDAVQV